jgi:hypothetical protein
MAIFSVLKVFPFFFWRTANSLRQRRNKTPCPDSIPIDGLKKGMTGVGAFP